MVPSKVEDPQISRESAEPPAFTLNPSSVQFLGHVLGDATVVVVVGGGRVVVAAHWKDKSKSTV